MKLLALAFVAFVNFELSQGRHATYYQIYPKSFKDSDGDGIGDIQGIIEKLDHLKDLGVTGMWLSPIFRSPMKDSGYDIQDFKTVDPMFGTNDDLKELFVKAKEMRLKIILDFVPNHTSDLHEWFILSANQTASYEDYYVWRDCPLIDAECVEDDCARILPNNWIAVRNTPAWTYHSGRGQCYLHQFSPEQPDLNYRNPRVYEEMLDVVKFWLIEGADGLRADAVNHLFESESLSDEPYIDPEGDRTQYDNLIHDHTVNMPESYNFIYDVRKMMDKFAETTEDKVARILMTEAYGDISQQVLWYGYNETIRGSNVPFNFVLISKLNKDSNAGDFKRETEAWLEAMPSFGFANWVLGNHDRSRVASRYGKERHEGLVIMTLMLPGNGIIFYGEEIGMTDNCAISWEETDDPAALQTNETIFMQYSRDPFRTPFQWDSSPFAGFTSTTGKTWLPVNANYLTVNLAAQQASAKSIYKLYQQLVSLRNKNHVLHMGAFNSKTFGNEIFAFTRTAGRMASLAVFVNLGSVASKVSLKDLFDGREFTSKTRAQILIVNTNSELPVGDFIENIENIQLGPYDAIVLEVSEEIDPTEAPTETPSNAPTEVPTNPPTEAPTNVPTEAPTNPPTTPASTTEATTLGSANVILSLTLLLASLAAVACV